MNPSHTQKFQPAPQGDPDHGVLPELGPQAITELVSHPRFDEAVLMAAAATVDLYRGNWILNRLSSDRGRFILGLMILDLHFVGGGGEGFSAARLRQEAAAYGISSPGRSTAFLASLRLLGLVKPIASADRRLRLLAPTERFIALLRERWRRNLAAVALLRPEGDAAIAALDNPAFIGAFAHTLASAFRGGFRVVTLVPELRIAAERDVGLIMLLALAIADASGQPISIAAMARRFLVSRAHVLTVFREAEQIGLAVVAGTRGGFRAGPALMPALRRFYAVAFLVHLHGIEAARRAGALDMSGAPA